MKVKETDLRTEVEEISSVNEGGSVFLPSTTGQAALEQENLSEDDHGSKVVNTKNDPKCYNNQTFLCQHCHKNTQRSGNNADANCINLKFGHIFCLVFFVVSQ